MASKFQATMTSSLVSSWAVLVGFLLVQLCLVKAEGIDEEARIQQWRDRGNTWPPTWQLEGNDYRAVMQKREDEIMSLTGVDERWANFVQFTQGRMLPGFTRLGFEVVDTPPELQTKIARSLAASFSNPAMMYDEESYPSSYNKYPVKIAPAVDVQEELLSQLQDRLEEWAGMKLEPTGSYGIRINREGSSQAMHYEQVATHVISALLHVASAYESPEEPWHVDIEDHRGVIHSVDLQPGQMLLYEGASCLHGRRGQLKGNYYASLYLHYRPADRGVWNYTIQDVVNNVPPHWRNGANEHHGDRYAGQALTIDSLIADGAPERVARDKAPQTIARVEPVFPWPGNTEAFKQAMALREKEIRTLPAQDERWGNYATLTQGLLVPRFTTHGFEVRQTPLHIQAQLRAALEEGLQRFDSLQDETDVRGTYGYQPAKIVFIEELIASIHPEMTALHEEWSGLQLRPTALYGIRANRNGSSLYMHTDRIETHVISSIVHIAHEYDDDDEPWPIEIEDHNGVLHALNLEAGQMLFYESAACLHGRRTVLKGKYYASIFAHYQPVDPAVWDLTPSDVSKNVPADWRDGIVGEYSSCANGQGMTIDSLLSQLAPPRVLLDRSPSSGPAPGTDEEL